jgi:hypothetical protein
MRVDEPLVRRGHVLALPPAVAATFGF